MAIGQILNIANNAAVLVTSQSKDSVQSLALLNPNDGICYIKLNGRSTPSPAGWDWKLPSQSYGLFPGPWQSLGVYYVDQSGSGSAAEVNLYDATAKLVVPEIHSIGRAVQVSGTTMDITQGPVPSNPPLSTVRLWADSSGNLHILESTGNDQVVLDSSNYGTYVVLAGDVVGPAGNTSILVRYSHQINAQNAAAATKLVYQFTGDNYNSFHCGDSGMIFVDQANTVRYGAVLNSSGLLEWYKNAQFDQTTLFVGSDTHNNIIQSTYNAGAPSGSTFTGGNLNLNSNNGTNPPYIGWHQPGVLGASLYLSSNGLFRAVQNSGQDYAFMFDTMPQTATSKTFTNSLWVYPYIVAGNGSVLSYGCFHVLQIGGGTYYMPASSGNAGKMIIAKNWVGAAVTLACQSGSVFGVGGAVGAPSTLTLQYGDCYTFISDGGAGWMVV